MVLFIVPRNLQYDWARSNPEMDFEINSKATLNLLLLAKKYSRKNPFIYFGTNKVYGDKINYESFIKKNRYEISKKQIL